MKCEVNYCIYNDEFFCILKETQLNSLGMCEECIIVSIPYEDLKAMKEKQLEDIERRWVKDIESKSDFRDDFRYARKRRRHIIREILLGDVDKAERKISYFNSYSKRLNKSRLKKLIIEIFSPSK